MSLSRIAWLARGICAPTTALYHCMKKSILVLNVLSVAVAAGLAVEAWRPRAGNAPAQPVHTMAVITQAIAASASSPARSVSSPVQHIAPGAEEVVLLRASHARAKPGAQLSAEWVEPRATLGEFLRQGQLRIYLDGQKVPLQTFEADASRDVENMSLGFMDLNGDGHADLVFDNAMTGAGGAAYGAEVFLWIPRLQRFVKSETLSQAGELSPGRAPNCVKVTTKCSSTAWQEVELCFAQATGQWDTLVDSGCHGAEPD